MDAKRWNYLISLVNADNPADSLKDELTEEEMRIYRNMERELAELRKTNPKAAFWPVEND